MYAVELNSNLPSCAVALVYVVTLDFRCLWNHGLMPPREDILAPVTIQNNKLSLN